MTSQIRHLSLRPMLLTTLSVALSSTLWAADYYVDGASGNDKNAGTSWTAAKKTIGNAYNAAADGDYIHVADGVYGRISVNKQKQITIASRNGNNHTFIDGEGSYRCVGVFMENWSTPDTGTIFDGFTIRNGYREGSGAGAYGGTFRNCRFTGNICTGSGGAAYGSTLENCHVVSNFAGNAAGAVYNGTMLGCEVYLNAATNWGGAFYGGYAENCVIAGNSCGRYGGGAYETTLIGCTVFANSADLGAGGTYTCAATNTIIWANKTGLSEYNWYKGTFGYCILKPMAEGVGNSAANPLLYSIEDLDGRICIGSPCLNTGCNDFSLYQKDAAGNDRIQQGTVDIGAYEGVVAADGNIVADAEKRLSTTPGVSSSFSFKDGSSAFIFGISPLTPGDFSETGVDGVLRYENSQIIDAEKSLSKSMDDLWCQELTEVNLSVWSGWSEHVGFTNEDDFAEYLREDPDFTVSTNILKWVLSRANCDYNTYVAWSWAKHTDLFVSELVSRTANADRMTYLQLDWVTPGTTNIIGSHALTCCGYLLANGKDGSSPSDLVGLFIIDSDNDKRNGDGGRYAPNSITLIPVAYDAEKGKFFLSYPGATGMLRFLCYLKARPNRQSVVATSSAPVAVPYSWLMRHGLYNPKSGISPEQTVLLKSGKQANGKEMSIWHDYVAGTNPNDPNDALLATIAITNGNICIGWNPNLGPARTYTVYGKTNLTDNAWHYPTNSGSRFFKVDVSICDAQCGCGFGFVPEEVLLATNNYVKYKGVPSLIRQDVVDAEKIDGTDLDDRGCGEAVGANMTFMTGWAQMAGFISEDDVFRTFYEQYGTADYGTISVVRFVFDRIPGENYGDYFYASGEFTRETFPIIEGLLKTGHAVGIKYLHGSPSAPNGNHVVTLWGVFKDLRYLPTDPRHYCAVALSDSDDDKTGYSKAEDAPNRLKIWPVQWNDTESVYEISDGYLVDFDSLASPPSTN